jgi:hypothetical protein
LKCPNCGGEMEKGYIQNGSTGFFWSEDKHSWRLYTDVEDLVGGRRADWRLANAKACRCKKCRKVIFEY